MSKVELFCYMGLAFLSGALLSTRVWAKIYKKHYELSPPETIKSECWRMFRVTFDTELHALNAYYLDILFDRNPPENIRLFLFSFLNTLENLVTSTIEISKQSKVVLPVYESTAVTMFLAGKMFHNYKPNTEKILTIALGENWRELEWKECFMEKINAVTVDWKFNDV